MLQPRFLAPRQGCVGLSLGDSGLGRLVVAGPEGRWGYLGTISRNNPVLGLLASASGLSGDKGLRFRGFGIWTLWLFSVASC